MTKTYRLTRTDLRNKDLKSAKRTTTGAKPQVRGVKRIAGVLKALK